MKANSNQEQSNGCNNKLFDAFSAKTAPNCSRLPFSTESESEIKRKYYGIICEKKNIYFSSSMHLFMGSETPEIVLFAIQCIFTNCLYLVWVADRRHALIRFISFVVSWFGYLCHRYRRLCFTINFINHTNC